jgi:hypothetical protein
MDEIIEGIRAAIKELSTVAQKVIDFLKDVVERLVRFAERYHRQDAHAYIRDLDRSWRFFGSHPDLPTFDQWLDSWFPRSGGEPWMRPSP